MPSHRELNPPACMLARLAYVLHLGSGLAGVLLLVCGGIGSRPSTVLLAALFAAASAAIAWMLRRVNWYSRCRDSFATLGLDGAAVDPGPDPELGALLERREAIEELRGTPAFDPWALLALQHEIDEHLRTRRGGGSAPGDAHGGSPGS